jgi:ABC-type branched-subunit amino acid transport system substrate-binding protein
MPKRFASSLSILVALGLLAACGSLTDDASTHASSPPAEKLDYASLGLWNDGPCDASKPKLVVGLMTVFDSPAISLKDQALALEASATAFNQRGGANGSCIDVHTCDDGANLDQSLACVKNIDGAGVVATINDEGTAGQAEVSAAMAAAGIPRIASNVTNYDWGDPNAYPIDASGTGFAFLLPQAMINEHVTKIGNLRVDLAAAAALKSFLESIYTDGGATFPVDVPVAAGTTDYSQYILTAANAGAEGVVLNVGQQDATQIIRAGQQLNTNLRIGTSPGTMSVKQLRELGDFAKQLVLLSSYAPLSIDLPVYKALRADFVASGQDLLQPDNVAWSPMRSWIGLYALLKMIRDTHLTDFTRQNITTMLRAAKDVPMLGMFGDENWTPNLDHPGAWTRAGTNHWAGYRWDPNATGPDGATGNFVQTSTIDFDKVLCGSALGAPPPC